MNVQYQLRAIRVFTTDLERSLSFYRKALGMTTEALSHDSGFALFDTGSAKLLLERVDPADPESRDLVGRFVGVSFSVPHVQEAYETLAHRGVSFIGRPEPQPGGGSRAHFEDPDGNVLTLVE